MSTQLFRFSDCPEHLTFIDWVKSQTDWYEAERRAQPRQHYPTLIELEGPELDMEAIRASVVEAMALYGVYGWATEDGGRSKSYVGFSLTYNPDHEEGIDVHASLLGSGRVSKNEYFARFTYQDENARTRGKNSYDDTYGFRTRTPASRHKALGHFIDRFSRPLLRSRVSAMRGSLGGQQAVMSVKHTDANRCDAGWHRDEPVFIHLRVNLPVTTHPSFRTQIEDSVDAYLEAGRLYSWDTDLPHRPIATERIDKVRVHLVLGFSPWLDYVEEERGYALNEYYGKVHPFDMLNEGLIFPGARVANACSHK
jgi:hypothetical protein